MKVLIIDDNQPHGESLVELLASRGHEAYYAPSRDDAEWLAGLFRFDLSVIDFDMPETTGLELARSLLERWPDLAVIIVSAHGPSPARSDVIGELAFFPKPIETAGFLALVERIHTQRRGSGLMVRETFPLQRYGPASRNVLPPQSPGREESGR
jgi:DNA-binding response OmpR family regulator